MRKENGLREDLKARWPSRAAAAASEREAARGARGGGTGRAGPGAGPGAARSAGLSLCRAAARSSRRCRLGVVEARAGRGGGGGAKEEEEKEEEGLGPGRGLAVGLRLAFPEEAGSLCGGRGSKWRHVDPRRNRAVVVPEDISHPVPAHWLRGATFTTQRPPAGSEPQEAFKRAKPRRPARTRAGPAARVAVTRGACGAGLGTAGSVDLVSRKHWILKFSPEARRTNLELGGFRNFLPPLGEGNERFRLILARLC